MRRYERGGGDRVQLHLHRSLGGTAFLTVWLTGWALGECLVARQLVKACFTALHRAPAPADMPPAALLFMAVWLLPWTIGGAVAVFALLWNVSGSEELLIDRHTLTLHKRLAGIGWAREFRLNGVTGLRAERDGDGSRIMNILPRALALESQGHTVRFGRGMTDEAAAAAVDDIRTLCPGLIDTAAATG